MKTMYASILCSTAVYAAEPIELQSQLEQGLFEQVINHNTRAQTNQSKFTKALCQLGASVESLQQDLYKYGLEVNSRTSGIRNLTPIPHNPSPQEVDYLKIRSLLETFHDQLHKIEQTLAIVGDDDFYLPLDLTKVRFDIDGNGERTELESSLALFLRLSGNGQLTPQQANEASKFDGTIGFDKSDLIWLKGYVQVTLGLTDLLLAHDFEQAFNAISSNLFQKPKDSLNKLGAGDENFGDVANLIAAFHLAKMPVIEPDHLKQARQHLLNMVDCSKLMWVSILAESDNRKEWLPSPKQQSVTGIKITDAMVTDWHTFLNEYQSILTGQKLVPHWRFKEKGINLKRALEESSETDIVLWITGHAATAYLEDGELTKGDLWRQLNRTFNGNFLGMSLFIN